MPERFATLVSTCRDPYRNIALEKRLMDAALPGVTTLYLWRNDHTIVVGRNQNPWAECAVTPFLQSGGRIARRLSGGGAVYHDGGNLNFTFINEKRAQDIARQTGVVLRALTELGIDARATGRNDLTTPEGFKFSGHAFYESAGLACHHGTLMVDTNLTNMAAYLTVPKDKLKARGVSSVRSRVRNLSALKPGLTVARVRDALLAAFAREYGDAEPLDARAFDDDALRALAARFASDAWVYGETKPFTFEASGRFPWGGVTLAVAVAKGAIADAAVYSDAMEADLIAALPALLAGCPLNREAVELRLSLAPGATAHPRLLSDVLTLLSSHM